MKTLIALLATAAFIAPAFAADAPAVPMTKADCDKTLDMKWDAMTKACHQSSAASGASDGTGSKTSIALRKQQLPTVARARPEPVRLEQMLVRPQPARLIALQRSKKAHRREVGAGLSGPALALYVGIKIGYARRPVACLARGTEHG